MAAGEVGQWDWREMEPFFIPTLIFTAAVDSHHVNVRRYHRPMLLRLVSGGGSLRVSGRASVLRGRTAATTASGGGATTSMTMSTAASIYVKENNDHSAIMQRRSGIGDPTASRMTKLDNGVTVLSSYSER